MGIRWGQEMAPAGHAPLDIGTTLLSHDRWGGNHERGEGTPLHSHAQEPACRTRHLGWRHRVELAQFCRDTCFRQSLTGLCPHALSRHVSIAFGDDTRRALHKVHAPGAPPHAVQLRQSPISSRALASNSNLPGLRPGQRPVFRLCVVAQAYCRNKRVAGVYQIDGRA